MELHKIDPFEYVDDVNHLMRNGGLLLVANGKEAKPNAMVIGWGLMGTLWRRPFFLTAVRCSRYTHKLIEESEKFAVCLPAKGMEKVLEICGKKSGRDIDKFKTLNITPSKGKDIDTPFIPECPVHFECSVAFKTEMKPGQLKKRIEDEVYPTKNMHTLYYGEIIGAYSIKDAADKLY